MDEELFEVSFFCGDLLFRLLTYFGCQKEDIDQLIEAFLSHFIWNGIVFDHLAEKRREKKLAASDLF